MARDAAPGKLSMLGELEHVALAQRQQLRGAGGREDRLARVDVPRTAGRRFDACDQLTLADAGDPPQGLEPVVGVGIDELVDETGDQILLARWERGRRSVQPLGLLGRESHVDGGQLLTHAR